MSCYVSRRCASGTFLVHTAIDVAFRTCGVFCVSVQVGPLECSGNGVPLDSSTGLDHSLLKLNRKVINSSVLSRLKTDVHHAELLAMCEEEASLGRMSKPRLLTTEDIENCTLSPRFAVEQGSNHSRNRLRSHNFVIHCAFRQASGQMAH